VGGYALATKATGTIWLRRQITLTQAQATAGAVLKLGVLDDMDMTFVNGRPVGNSFGWDYEREYTVPPAYLHAGVNEIMVAVTNSYADGGFQSKPEVLQLAIKGGASLPLAEGWRFSISGAKTYPPRAPWDANGGIGVMHNRMIAPLGSLALKGVAWYQGESDVDTPGYRQRLSALIDGWRGQFGADLRVLVVQLANYGPVQKGRWPPTRRGCATISGSWRRRRRARRWSAPSILARAAISTRPTRKLWASGSRFQRRTCPCRCRFRRGEEVPSACVSAAWRAAFRPGAVSIPSASSYADMMGEIAVWSPPKSRATAW
jgi:hypothetical protein